MRLSICFSCSIRKNFEQGPHQGKRDDNEQQQADTEVNDAAKAKNILLIAFFVRYKALFVSRRSHKISDLVRVRPRSGNMDRLPERADVLIARQNTTIAKIRRQRSVPVRPSS